jgi:hypothetical protein
MKQFIIAAAATLLSAAGFAQEKKDAPVKPPAAAEAAFKKAYPNATGVKWSAEEGDYEVNFKQAKLEMSAVYTAAGALKETEEEISKSALPASITAYVKQHYKGSIKAAAKITDAKGDVTYEVEVGETEVFFTKDGKFLKEEKEEGEEKDKD